MTTITSKSTYYQKVFKAFFWLTPFIILVSWLLFNELPEDFTKTLYSDPPKPLPLSGRLAAALTCMLPGTVWMCGLKTISTIFGTYAKQEFFSHSITRLYKKLGICFYIWIIMSVISTPLLSIAVSFHNPPGERTLQLSIGTGELSAFILGSIILILAGIMDEARKLKEEQDHTI